MEAAMKLQEENKVDPIKEYLRGVFKVPQLKEVEIDKENWKIKNSDNYDEINRIDEDWREKIKTDREYEQQLPLCVRCGSGIHSNSTYKRRRSKILTICEDCLKEDKGRLVEAFEEKWNNRRFKLTKRGKEAKVTDIVARSDQLILEDLSIAYTMQYVDSGISCRSDYTLDDIYISWELGSDL